MDLVDCIAEALPKKQAFRSVEHGTSVPPTIEVLVYPQVKTLWWQLSSCGGRLGGVDVLRYAGTTRHRLYFSKLIRQVHASRVETRLKWLHEASTTVRREGALVGSCAGSEGPAHRY